MTRTLTHEKLWTDAKLAQLAQLWNEKRVGGQPLYSTADIAMQMGMTKNAIIGKAHRLGLPPRPSPIRASGSGEKPRREPRQIPKLPPLPSLAGVVAEPPKLPPAPRVPRPVPRPAPTDPKHPCCWPIGEPGKPGFRFCGAPSLVGKPYCEEHAKRAYIRPSRAAA